MNNKENANWRVEKKAASGTRWKKSCRVA